jgi:hypothetical protein
MMKNFCQHDPLWRDDHIGASNLTVGAYGCAGCCVCDISTAFNPANGITPKELFAHKDWFTPDGLFLWGKLQVHGLKFDGRLYRFDEAAVKSACSDPNRAAMIEVMFGQFTHWVVAVRKDLLNGWRIADPLTGTYRWMPNAYKPIGVALFSRAT